MPNLQARETLSVSINIRAKAWQFYVCRSRVTIDTIRSILAEPD